MRDVMSGGRTRTGNLRALTCPEKLSAPRPRGGMRSAWPPVGARAPGVVQLPPPGNSSELLIDSPAPASPSPNTPLRVIALIAAARLPYGTLLVLRTRLQMERGFDHYSARAHPNEGVFPNSSLTPDAADALKEGGNRSTRRGVCHEPGQGRPVGAWLPKDLLLF